jgi:hypothetical protein
LKKVLQTRRLLHCGTHCHISAQVQKSCPLRKVCNFRQWTVTKLTQIVKNVTYYYLEELVQVPW